MSTSKPKEISKFEKDLEAIIGINEYRKKIMYALHKFGNYVDAARFIGTTPSALRVETYRMRVLYVKSKHYTNAIEWFNQRNPQLSYLKTRR
jgi:hypothetical protein